MEIAVRGVGSARAAAERLAGLAGVVGAEGEGLVGERVGELWQAARAYEPRPLPSYRRSGRLMRSWRVERRGALWLVGSEVPYARFVRGMPGGQGQAWMHAGRWRLLRDMAERVLDLRAELVARLKDKV